MEDLSLHILDIVENSVRAHAQHIMIRLIQNKEEDLLVLQITDDGEGMKEETLKQSMEPFFTTKAGKRIGLGLSFLAQAAEEAHGRLEVESALGRGTRVTATFRMSHLDRKPIGNLEETIRCLKATHPEVRFSVESMKSD